MFFFMEKCPDPAHLLGSFGRVYSKSMRHTPDLYVAAP